MWPGPIAKEHPDKAAHVMASTGEVVTYRQLDDRSNQLAQFLFDAGLRFGDHFALLLENHPRFFEVCWAGQRSGLLYTAVNSHFNAEETAYILDDCDARVFVTSYAKRELAAELLPILPATVEHRLMIGGTIDGYASYEDSIGSFPAEPLAEELEGNAMLYSSGTTGRPKGIRISAERKPMGQPTLAMEGFRVLFGIDDSSVYLSPAPLYHSAPLQFSMVVQRVGGTVVVMEHFDPEEALRLVEQYGVTHSQWVPTMFVRMLKLPKELRDRYDMASMKVAIHAAAPCPVPVKEQMIEWWGPIIHEYYSATEALGATIIDSEQWLAHKGSVGKPLGAPVHILDDEFHEVPTGEPGTIFFETPGDGFQYHKDRGKTEGTKSPQGWRSVGDVGYVDEEGYLYLTDRKTFMIVSGGVNIYPQEVENLLVTHPKVFDVAVFGVPNEEMGEEVKAVVQPVDWADAGPALERELADFCREHLARYKCPRSVDFERELPRQPTGKLYKRLLRDRYWGKHDTRIV